MITEVAVVFTLPADQAVIVDEAHEALITRLAVGVGLRRAAFGRKRGRGTA